METFTLSDINRNYRDGVAESKDRAGARERQQADIVALLVVLLQSSTVMLFALVCYWTTTLDSIEGMNPLMFAIYLFAFVNGGIYILLSLNESLRR